MSELQSQYTVSELNSQIRHLLEGSLSNIWVIGEISNFHHHPSSGHMYFTLKDTRGEMRCAMFRGNNLHLKFKPSDGMEVRLFGSVTVYEQRGQVQLKVSRMEPAGIGDLFKAFEAMKKSLRDEGIFDEDHKKSIPKFPNNIGIVTSGSGAALQDIIHVLNRRAPHVDILIRSTKVQGDGAAQDISSAIQEFNEFGLVDVIIVGRGGGSIEDLWAFNEEIVARSIFESNIPIISAVGHETDFTIADFVSDLRAPTPSVAAELSCDSSNDILNRYSELKNIMSKIVQGTIDKSWNSIDYLENRINLQQPQKIIQEQVEKIFQYRQRFMHEMDLAHTYYLDKTMALSKQLVGLGPDQVLNRGYSIAFDKFGEIIRKSTDLKIGEEFILKTGTGSLDAKKTSDISNS
jgi:exodeoxyribonuclease VII large subunit